MEAFSLVPKNTVGYILPQILTADQKKKKKSQSWKENDSGFPGPHVRSLEVVTVF